MNEQLPEVLSEDTAVFFWKVGKPSYIHSGCLSQWWLSAFVDEEAIRYTSAEQYMMYRKAILFNDAAIAKEILARTNPFMIKNLGRRIANFNATIWDNAKFDIVVKANQLKFAQNTELFIFLLLTQDKILVEASPVDCVWGIGLDEHNPDRFYPDRWKGENLLGKALMQARELLRST